ncbi:MAG: glycosyltransferase [Clostridiales bacterium]|nr:glycosyltransferase [Clostridiales bacterium]
MVTNGKVSVIVPVYNVEKYLGECLESIIGQSYRDLDIILVDDGSTDGSGDICDIYAKKDGRIRVIHKKNGGLSSARNAGLDAAKGGWFVYVDSDDFISRDMIRTMASVAEKHDAEIVKCNFISFKDGETEPDHSDDTGKETVYTSKEAIKNFLTEEYSRKKPFGINVWNALYKTDTAGSLRFPEGLIYEDGYYSPRAFMAAKTLVHIDSTLYFYRENPASITGGGITDKSLKSVDDWEYIYKCISEKFPDKAVYAVPRWIEKLLVTYDTILLSGKIDASGDCRRHIIEKLKENKDLFFDFADKDQLKKIKALISDPEKYARMLTGGSLINRFKASVKSRLK